MDEFRVRAASAALAQIFFPDRTGFPEASRFILETHSTSMFRRVVRSGAAVVAVAAVVVPTSVHRLHTAAAAVVAAELANPIARAASAEPEHLEQGRQVAQEPASQAVPVGATIPGPRLDMRIPGMAVRAAGLAWRAMQ